MIKLWDWLMGWYHTRQIKKNNPELYKFLCDFEFNEDNFEEVPGKPGVYLHKNVLETMRQLGEDNRDA
jgi:hypothetical protein